MKHEQNDLIEGFKSNDRRSLNTIYLMHYEHVERYILKNNGSDMDAKDIFQEAIIAAWLNVKEGKFVAKNAESLGGYLFQISKYKWLDKLKSKVHRSTMRIEREEFVSEAESENIVIDDQSERLDYLKRIYASLDRKCKSILDRFYYQKMSLEDIGQDLNYDGATVKTLKYRCMKKLRLVHNSTLNAKK